MTATRETVQQTGYNVPGGGEWRGVPAPASGWPGYPVPTRDQNRGRSGWGILGLAALGLVIVGGIYLWPDIQRYMRIRSM
jgi:hypothetical protein